MVQFRTIGRRQCMRSMLAAGALSLTGCESLIRAVAETCPEDPAESGGVDWTPDVLHPVFYGFQDLDPADGAPATLRIWYPTYEGFTDGPPILKMCVIRWPVVLFLHGQPPCPDVNYYRRWAMLPAVLARSGYVVVVPSHTAIFPAEAESPAVQNALEALDWVRGGWEHSRWVDSQAEATAVAGHSYGALLAARVAQARPAIAAYVGLSGPWLEFSSPLPVLQAIGAPSFFMWGTGDPIDSAFESLDGGGLWDQVPSPKHAGVFPGEHFDYLRPWAGCNFSRGSCTLIEAVAAELAALFIARHAPVNISSSQIPLTLEPPDVVLTQAQQFFAGGHLSGLSQFETQAGCSLGLRWVDGATSGQRELGP